MPTVTVDLVEYDKLRDKLKSQTKIIAQMADSDNCLVIPRYVWKSHSTGDELLDIHSTKDVLEHLDAALVKELTALAMELAPLKEAERRRVRKAQLVRGEVEPNAVVHTGEPKRWWQSK